MLIRHSSVMDLRQLRYFLAVVDGGTVTAAAGALHIAQPAVSRQLQQLERELAIQLFERHGPRLQLTAAGRQFADRASELVVGADHLLFFARQLASGRVHSLMIAASPTATAELIAPFIATLRAPDPLLKVRPLMSLSAAGELSALRDRADLVISTAVPNRALNWQTVATVPLLAHVSAEHRWAKEQRTSIDLNELVAEELILTPGTFATRTILDRAVVSADLDYGSVEESDDTKVIQALAAGGFGVGVTTDRPLHGTHAVTIRGASGSPDVLTLTMHASWEREHAASAVIEGLVGRLADHAANDHDRIYS